MKLIHFTDLSLGPCFVDADRIVGVFTDGDDRSLVVFDTVNGTSHITVAIDATELASLIERRLPDAEIIFLS